MYCVFSDCRPDFGGGGGGDGGGGELHAYVLTYLCIEYLKYACLNRGY